MDGYDLLLVLGAVCYVSVGALLWAGIVSAVRAVIRALRSARHRRAVGFAFMVLALGWLGLKFGLVPGAAAYRDYSLTRNLFGRSFPLGQPRLSSNSPRSLTGDGDSIAVYDIPAELAQWMASRPADFLIAYPKRSLLELDWSVDHWRATPISPKARDLLQPFLEQENGTSDYIEASRLLGRLVREPGNYVALFYYKGAADHITNVGFYVVSPSKRILISGGWDT